MLSLSAAASAQSFRLDFQDGVGAWNTVLDGVMGGLSTGRVSQPEQGLLRFAGELSLENNGGFSQMRRSVREGSMEGAEGLLLEVKGDGRTYNFDIRQSNVRLMAGGFQRSFATVAGEWTEVRLPLSDFELYSFGRKLRSAPTLDPNKIESIGVTLSDKKSGPFALEVRSIAAYGAGADAGDGGADGTGDDLGAVAKAAGLNKLLALVQAAELALPESPVTILAPTDAAFDALPEETVAALLKPAGRATLRTILQHHVVLGATASGDVLNRRALTSAIGQKLAVDDLAQTIGGAGIVATDVPFDGGVVHVIDAVLMPETRSITKLAVDTDELKTLVTAVQAAGLSSQFGGDSGPWTVFAPVNSAFAKLPEATLKSLLERSNRRALTDILGLHVVPGRIAARDLLAKKKLTTLMGEPIAVALVDRKLQVGGATITTADIQASNGVVHLIDGVITEPLGGKRAARGDLEPRRARNVDAAAAAMRVYEVAINRGAGLWNDGNRDGCAAVYEVAISAMIGLGRDRLPQAVVDALVEGLDRGESQEAVEAAWTYRAALDSAYRQLRR
ncbi:MAG: CIA30 family protein [Planctomycetota bacterium]|nr:CIA30 family protein [Planctomycetota bacterium]